MWNQDRSVLLSLVCTRILMVLGLILALIFLLPALQEILSVLGVNVAPGTLWLAPLYFAFCVPAYVSLVSLDRLLAAVRRNEVFTQRNTRFLRIISWCCVAVALILLVGVICSGFSALFLIIPAVIAAFFGVILRVVKNLFAAAMALKDENDFTI